MSDKGLFDNMSAKQGLIMGLSWGVAGVALIGLVVFAANGSVFQVGTGDANNNANPTVIPSQQQPTAVQPTPEPAGDISKIPPVTDADYIRGAKNAKITMIEYSDFQCPFCSRHKPTLDKVLADYDGQVRLIYRHFPLTSIHPQAQKSAEASECAGEQGKFWEMHDELFANQTDLAIESLKRYARNISGINGSQFDQCLDSGKYASKINQQAAEAQAGGITGTPGTFVGSELVKGAYPYDTFKQIIDAM